MAPPTRHPVELASAITTRRKELGLSVVDVHERSGIARSTWSKIEMAQRERIARKTLEAIDEVLDWEDGQATCIYRLGVYRDGSPVQAFAWLNPYLESVNAATKGYREMQEALAPYREFSDQVAALATHAADMVGRARLELIRLVADELDDLDVYELLRVAKRLVPPTAETQYDDGDDRDVKATLDYLLEQIESLRAERGD